MALDPLEVKARRCLDDAIYALDQRDTTEAELGIKEYIDELRSGLMARDAAVHDMRCLSLVSQLIGVLHARKF